MCFSGASWSGGWGRCSFLDHAAMNARAGELFAELKSETRPRDLVKSMSGGQRQAVAIARTRLADPKIVLMDEPTAAISVRQVAEVLDLIRHLKATGHAVILISPPHPRRRLGRPATGSRCCRRGRKVADKPIAASSPEEVDRADHRCDRGGVKASRSRPMRGIGALSAVARSARVSIAQNVGQRPCAPSPGVDAFGPRGALAGPPRPLRHCPIRFDTGLPAAPSGAGNTLRVGLAAG